MINSIRAAWQQHPLRMILLIAICLRLISVIYSKGYGFSDDHFEVIEPAQSWVEGGRTWLQQDDPPLHSILYAGVHFAVFYLSEQAGITDPQSKMMLIRFLHAFWSLLIVWFGYKITLKISGKETAKWVGLMLAALWYMPFMSVRSLNEMACIPFVLGAFYSLISKPNRQGFLLAGVLLGIALCIRFQCSHFLAGIGIVLLYQKSWGKIVFLSLGTLVSAFAIQGLIDLRFFDYPFQTFVHYVTYNATQFSNYPTGPVYQYLFVVLGMLVPPLSLFLLFGFFKSWKKAPYLFWATMVFIIVHSLYPGKQERFILPVLPLIIILGMIGWREFFIHSGFWLRHLKLWKGLVAFSLVINTLALAVMTPNYSKKTRAEGLYFLSDKEDVCGIIVESDHDTNPLAPKFYLGKNADVAVYDLPANKSAAEIYQEVETSEKKSPNYILFYGSEGLDKRVEHFKKQSGTDLSFKKKIEPDLYDQILHLLNPVHNRNEICRIYKIQINC